MHTDTDVIGTIERLLVLFQRGLQTSVGSPTTFQQKQDFRNMLIKLFLVLDLDSDSLDIYTRAARNARIPDGNALWED